MSFLQGFPCGTYNSKGQKLALGIVISRSEVKKASEDATLEEDSKCLSAEADGEGEKSSAEVNEDRCFWLVLVLLWDSLHRILWLYFIGMIVSTGSSR